MNVQSILACLVAIAILVAVVLTSGENDRLMNMHAILVVIGGTIAAGAISFQVDRFLLMFRIFFENVLRRKNVHYVRLIAEIARLAEAYRIGSPGLKAMVAEVQDPFLREAMTMVLEDFLDRERLIKILHERVDTIYLRECEEVVQFRTIGRYPPAFGLIGTTLSMITLLGKLGGTEGQKIIGPAMAIGLVSTFYGLILSNLVFQPIAENLAQATRRKQIKNTIIVEGVQLILEKTNPVVLAEELNSYLTPSERVDWHAHSDELGIKAA